MSDIEPLSEALGRELDRCCDILIDAQKKGTEQYCTSTGLAYYLRKPQADLDAAKLAYANALFKEQLVKQYAAARANKGRKPARRRLSPLSRIQNRRRRKLQKRNAISEPYSRSP